MTTPCPRRNTRTALTRTGALAVVFSIAFAPSAAYAQSAEPTTVKALIAGDGSVSSVERLPGGPAPAASEIPVKIGISQASEGDVTTTNYQVQNTSVQKKTVEYVGADGLPATMEQDVSLPLVGQLSVRLPASRTEVTAFGARITKLADGSSELVWSMVLFSPIGAPITDVSFSAKGKGEPVARLDVATVSPNSEPGLSATSQAANATVNGNGILGTVGNGASEGLTKLAEGVGKLLEGLNKLEEGAVKLNTGLVSAADGADQLAVGGAAAVRGANDLAAGAGKVNAGAGQLAAGAGKVDAGVGKISDGLASASAGGDKLAAGGAQLAPGAAKAAAGAKDLSAGLTLISGGLAQLNDVGGLPAALAGAQALRAGVDRLHAGLGDPATDMTILNGVAKISGGLSLTAGGLAKLGAPTGLPAAKAGVDQIKAGIDQKILPGLGEPGTKDTIRFGVDQVRSGLENADVGVDQLIQLVTFARAGIVPACGPGGPSPQPATPCEAANTALFGLDHAVRATGPNDPGGLRQRSQAGADGLGLVESGLAGIVKGLTNADPKDPNFPGISQGLGFISGTPSNGPLDPGPDVAATGLTAAIEGVALLQTGVGQLRDGVDGVPNPKTGLIDNGLTFGLNRVKTGLKSGAPLVQPDGSPTPSELLGVAEGLDKLVIGLTSAVTGVGRLAPGAAAAKAGSTALADGTQQIADGASALAAGNTSLNSGLTQLFTGSKELKAGTTALSTGAGTLAAGTPALAAGAGKLADGVGKIAAGNQKLADGLPAAADGSGAIAEGLGKVIEGETSVGTGIGDVNSKAVAVLQSQFKQGTTLARQQLAGLDAASALAASTPGAQNTTYVLSQSKGEISAKLASADGSNTARNIGLAAGGVLLLLGGIAGGFVSGRKASVA